MAIAMVRIDDRLIHGQVVAGWCPVIHPDYLILCDDDIASSDWECQLYKDAALEYETSVLTVAETAELLQGPTLDSKKVFVVVASPRTVVRLLDHGLQLSRVVVGGMHFQPGKRRINDFIFIDDDDLKSFELLLQRGVALEAKDVPTCKPIDLAALLGLK
jgi:mannose/fructose/N-acetylgalactosamine-specific phosphotransferase system component IIB